MTRILGMADLHIGATHLTSLADQELALSDVVELVRREHVDVVVVAGDSAHDAHPTTAVIEVLGQFAHALELLNVDVVFVEGNHDRGLPGIAQHFRGRVHAVTAPRIISLAGVDIAALPYLPDSFVRARAGGAATKEQIAHLLTTAAAEIIDGFLAQRRPGIPMVFAGHATVAGSETSTGFNLGFLPGTAWLLQREQLARFDAAIVGHIHKASRSATTIVPGSLLPLDFSETEPKGVWLFEVDEEMPIDIGWRTITSPRVETYELGGREAIESFVSRTPALANARVRIRVSCDEQTAREYPPATVAREAYAAGASLVQVELNVDRSERRRDASMTDELQPAGAIARYLAGTLLPAVLRPRVESLANLTIANVETSGPRAGGDLALVEVSAQDFIGIREATLSLDGDGLYAITGPVGAGKSSLGSDAARFALFGESRAGAKDRDRLIRQGADSAMASATLRSVDGHLFKVVRKIKRTSRGSVSTVDVLERNGADWRPLSDGKVASGQLVVDRILGGLSDETLVTGNLVLQRESDRYARAPREDRRRVLAEAAGLAIYDRLADNARELQRGFEKQLGELHAAAAPLAARADEIPGTERELAELSRYAAGLESGPELPAAREAVTAARLEHERAKDHFRALDAARDRVRSLEHDLTLINGDVAAVEGKIERTTAGILSRCTELEGAAALLQQKRAEITALELRQESEADEARAAAAAELEATRLERELATLRGERSARVATLDSELASIDRQERRLADAQCPVIDQIRAKALPTCSFLGDAQLEVRGRDALERELATLSDGSPEEVALAERIANFPLPDAPDTRATITALAGLRLQATSLETSAQWAAKIPEAEAYVAAETTQLLALRERAAAKRTEIVDAKAEHERIRTQAPDGDTGTRLDKAEARVQELEHDILTTARAIARIEGRLAELRIAAAQAEQLAGEIRDSAFEVAAAIQLVSAWRACRVMVLETSVLPAVEDTTNEILRRFPYGLQLRFATQRDRKSGDGQTEALDIEVLGGHGPIYELCSGGECTVIDFALHVAIALIVSRRAGSRLRYLFLDEPAFLDPAGYEAYASVVRWIHEDLGLTVLVSSHVRDLVDALGAREFVVVPGPDGSRLREEALA